MGPQERNATDRRAAQHSLPGAPWDQPSHPYLSIGNPLGTLLGVRRERLRAAGSVRADM
jgi:hypothetical protein